MLLSNHPQLSETNLKVKDMPHKKCHEISQMANIVGQEAEGAFVVCRSISADLKFVAALDCRSLVCIVSMSTPEPISSLLLSIKPHESVKPSTFIPRRHIKGQPIEFAQTMLHHLSLQRSFHRIARVEGRQHWRRLSWEGRKQIARCWSCARQWGDFWQ